VYTEIDVNKSNIQGTPDDVDKIVAGFFSAFTKAALDSGNSLGITTWGVNSEQNKFIPKYGGVPAMLFQNSLPTPADFAVRDVLSQAQPTS
jgi:hypothetical protein